MLFNTQSIVNKLGLLENLILSYNPHILVITETWLHVQIQYSEVVPASYKLIRPERTTRRGGVAIAIKKNLQYTVLENIPDHESLWCRIKYADKGILLGDVYRPPNTPPNLSEVMHDYISWHTNSRLKIILTGDLNLPGINWANLSHDGREVRKLFLHRTQFFFAPIGLR